MSPPADSEIHVRLTLDYYENYIFLDALRLILGENSKRRDIKNLLVKNPDLQKINFFRNVEWLQNQKNKEKIFLDILKNYYKKFIIENNNIFINITSFDKYSNVKLD